MPRVMRDTSSRSSTSRTRWLTCRSITSLTRSDHGIVEAGGLEQVQRGQQRRERIAQLVAERRQELVLAPVGEPQRLLARAPLGQVLADLVLALARAQRGAHRADQRRHPHRPLEQRHVAQRPHGFARPRRNRRRGASRTSTGRSDHGGCAASTRGQRGVVRRRRRFLGQQHRAGARRQLVEQRLERRGRCRRDARRRQHRLRDRCVLARSAPGRAAADRRVTGAAGHVPPLSRRASRRPRTRARRSARRGTPAAARRR